MTSDIPTFLRDFASYLRQPAHWTRPVFVALGGYGAALAAWELSHPAGLEAYVFQNDLGLDARRDLLVGLLGSAAAVTFGPYTDLQAGNYRATFYLKMKDTPQGARVATVDVFTHLDGYPRAVREVFGRDFSGPAGYQAFAVDFNTSGKPLDDVEFRVTYDFTGDLWVDRVDLEYLN